MDGLKGLGLRADDIVMVHSSMRALGPVLGGPNVVIQSLLRVVGEGGTVAMYVDWEDGAQRLTREDRPGELPAEWLEEWPVFDPATARAQRSYGILPEFLRTWPGARRSRNPGASIAAVGAQADWICADHPLNYGYGPGSPLAKIVEAEGRVLLLGSPLENITLLHYAEHVARLAGKRVIRYREKLLRDGRAEWVDIEEYDTSDPVVASAPPDHFDRLVRDYLKSRTGSNRTRSGETFPPERHEVASGRIGAGMCYLFEAARLHRFAVAWLEERWGED